MSAIFCLMKRFLRHTRVSISLLWKYGEKKRLLMFFSLFLQRKGSSVWHCFVLNSNEEWSSAFILSLLPKQSHLVILKKELRLITFLPFVVNLVSVFCFLGDCSTVLLKGYLLFFLPFLFWKKDNFIFGILCLICVIEIFIVLWYELVYGEGGSGGHNISGL